VLGEGAVLTRAAGVREGTVTRAVAELEAGEAPPGPVRREGGGRNELAGLDPGLRPALLSLVEPDMRGDPMSPLRWTVKSTRKRAAELTRQATGCRRTRWAGCWARRVSLQGNAKIIDGRVGRACYPAAAAGRESSRAAALSRARMSAMPGRFALPRRCAANTRR
jgi:hypothetical protein